MKVSVLTVAAVSLVFAFVEYIQHREYNRNHSDQKPCGSGVIGFVIIAVALFVIGIR